VKNIAILGAKIIGSTLGQKWARVGHSVMFAVRNINNPEVLDFAFPGDAMGETVQTCGPALNGSLGIAVVVARYGGWSGGVKWFSPSRLAERYSPWRLLTF
jgi:predicted dinucleotide-binding enzyme